MLAPISDLPKVDNQDWPWTADLPEFPPTLPDGSPWPKISIVTPSFNQAQFLEETIRSVLMQGYPNLEYILIDGGSTDGSVEIIKKYDPWLAYWVSEKDKGQSHAINKGFTQASGDIGGWLNSDDIYLPGALKTIGFYWTTSKRSISLITGTKLKGNVSLESNTLIKQSPYTIEHLLEKCILEQPATFFPMVLFQKVNGVDERYHMALDYDLWLRMTLHGATLLFTEVDLAITRNHPMTKSSRFQRRSNYEALLSVWRNYRVIPDSWLKKYVTSLVVPRDLKTDLTKRIFYYLRNIFYLLARKFLIILRKWKPSEY